MFFFLFQYSQLKVFLEADMDEEKKKKTRIKNKEASRRYRERIAATNTLLRERIKEEEQRQQHILEEIQRLESENASLRRAVQDTWAWINETLSKYTPALNI